MREEIIPVYSISDLAKSESATDDFKIAPLENCLKSARRSILDAHRHDYFELFWVEKGGGKLSVDFDSYEIKAPMILIFSPGRVHAWKRSADTSGLVIRFERKFFAAYSDSEDAAE